MLTIVRLGLTMAGLIPMLALPPTTQGFPTIQGYPTIKGFSATYGPKPGMLCPFPSVLLLPGVSIQAAVSAAPAGTTFCISAGIFPITAPIVPKSGDTFVGLYGAIIDGTSWQTTDTQAGAFQALNQDIDDVTIRNLVIRNMPMRGIHAYSSGLCDQATHTCSFSTAGADRWTIEDNELAYCAFGLNAPNNSVVRGNYVHHSAGDAATPVPAAYSAYLSHDVLFERNRFSYNGPQSKITLTYNVTFRDNFFDHNVDAIWYDGENTNALIEGNVVEDSLHHGIFYEASGTAVIRNNIVRRSADTGILISSSHNVEIYGNTLEGNWRGITDYFDCSQYLSSSGGWLGEPFYMENVDVHDNVITVPAMDWVLAGALAYGSCDAADAAPYLDGSKRLTFTRNTYNVPLVDASYWLWGGGYLGWQDWQRSQQDVAGTLR